MENSNKKEQKSSIAESAKIAFETAADTLKETPNIVSKVMNDMNKRTGGLYFISTLMKDLFKK